MVVRWQQWWRRHGVRVHRHFHEADSSLSCKMLCRVAHAVNYGSLHIRCGVYLFSVHFGLGLTRNASDSDAPIPFHEHQHNTNDHHHKLHAISLQILCFIFSPLPSVNKTSGFQTVYACTLLHSSIYCRTQWRSLHTDHELSFGMYTTVMNVMHERLSRTRSIAHSHE